MNKSKLSKQDIENIISEYLTGKTAICLSKKYNISTSYIYYFASKYKIYRGQHRKYQVNENFFDSINSQDKAYILGLMYADGCNSPEQNNVRIILTESDKYLLERISAIVFKQYRPLNLRKGGFFVDKGRSYYRQNSYQLSIFNKHISETLLKHGLTKAKTFTIVFPEWLDKQFISHFIRGYFDGDGSVSLSNGQISISILGTESFCLSLQNITNKLSIKSSICHAKKGSLIKQYVLHGNQTGRKFLEWIYRDASIYMERKYKKYQEIINIIPKAKPTKCLKCDQKPKMFGYCNKHYYKFIGRKIRHDRYIATKT